MTTRSSSSMCVEVLTVASLVDAIVVAATCYRVCQERGFTKRFATEVAIVTQELATNIVKHGGGRGTIELRTAADQIEVIALDEGPGIESIDWLVCDGVSRGRPVVPATRAAGLGCGGGAIARLSDALSVEARPGGGARVVATKRI